MYSDSNDEVKGFHDNDTNDIYINLNNTNDTDDIIKTIGHETAHNNTKDEEVARNTENFASRMNKFKELINFAGKGNSNNEILKNHITKTTQNELMRNNELARRVVDRSDRTDVLFNNETKKATVINAIKDNDTGIYDQNGERIGKTLFDDDYIGRQGAEINFDTDVGKALGKEGLYGDIANKFVEDMKGFEGAVTDPYIDTKANVTIGIGSNISRPEQIRDVELVDKKTGRVLTNQEKETLRKEMVSFVEKNKEFEDVKNKNGQVIGERLTTESTKTINKYLLGLNYKMSEKQMYTKLVNDIESSKKELNTRIPDYNDKPLDGRLGLLDMQFNMGSSRFNRKRWPELYKAIDANDWNKAADNSERFGIQGPRNDFVYERFKKAAEQQ